MPHPDAPTVGRQNDTAFLVVVLFKFDKKFSSYTCRHTHSSRIHVKLWQEGVQSPTLFDIALQSVVRIVLQTSVK